MKLFVHRKGATRAFPAGAPEIPAAYRAIGQPVIIPGSMGTESYVLVGQQAALDATFGTTCHGAGRALSRAAAKRGVRGEDVVQRPGSPGHPRQGRQHGRHRRRGAGRVQGRRSRGGRGARRRHRAQGGAPPAARGDQGIVCTSLDWPAQRLAPPSPLLLAAGMLTACGPGGTRPITKFGLQAPFSGFDESLGYSVIGADAPGRH